MAKDDIFLGLEMGRLEIEPVKLNKKPKTEENPFVPFMQQRSISKRSHIIKCSCSMQRKHTNADICKKKQNRLLKEPVLKLLSSDTGSAVLTGECLKLSQNHLQIPLSKRLHSDTFSLCTLVQNCNQLKISSGLNEGSQTHKDLNNDRKWWRNDMSESKEARESRQNNVTSTCSQQALNPPCDVTIDELASYFETLVHIPKKMSSMAEMMYI